MKKFISVIAIMLMLALTACSNKETPPTTDNSGNTQSDSVTITWSFAPAMAVRWKAR